MGLFGIGGFVGEFRHNRDDKGRLTIPASWRPDVASSDNRFFSITESWGIHHCVSAQNDSAVGVAYFSSQYGGSLMGSEQSNL